MKGLKLSKKNFCFSKKFLFKIVNKLQEFILAFKEFTEKITERKNKVPSYIKIHVEKSKIIVPFKTRLKVEI